jgi:hypothetical protein
MKGGVTVSLDSSTDEDEKKRKPVNTVPLPLKTGASW